MSDLTDRLDAIHNRADKATPGHWEASTGMADSAIVFMPDGYSFKINGHPDAKFIAGAREDVPFLFVLARKQQAAIDAVKALHVMEFIEDGEDSRSRCDECLYEQDADEPCPTIQALGAKP